jgi:hypothetical protein
MRIGLLSPLLCAFAAWLRMSGSRAFFLLCSAAALRLRSLLCFLSECPLSQSAISPHSPQTQCFCFATPSDGKRVFSLAQSDAKQPT